MPVAVVAGGGYPRQICVVWLIDKEQPVLCFTRTNKVDNMKKPQIPVSLEGYPFILFAAFTSLVFALLGYDILALAGFFLTGFVLYFFRDPMRISPDGEDGVLSPADGKVILVERLFDDRFVKDHVCKISIFMNVFNVHVNRVPFSGKVTQRFYSPGKFFAANTEQGALENEHCALVVTTPDEKKIAVVQIAGLVARRIVCWAEKGDELERGRRFGLIRFGSRVDIYLPKEFQLEVTVGQQVKAGETVLGYLA